MTKEPPLALVLLKDPPYCWRFSGVLHLWARGLCWKGHCDLVSRYSEAHNQRAGHLLYSLGLPMSPVSQCLG